MLIFLQTKTLQLQIGQINRFFHVLNTLKPLNPTAMTGHSPLRLVTLSLVGWPPRAEKLSDRFWTMPIKLGCTLLQG